MLPADITPPLSCTHIPPSKHTLTRLPSPSLPALPNNPFNHQPPTTHQPPNQPPGTQPPPADPLYYWYSRAYRALKQRVSSSEPSKLVREYQHVVTLDYSISHSSSVAKSKAAAGRNRYTNVLPYDHNRFVW